LISTTILNTHERKIARSRTAWRNLKVQDRQRVRRWETLEAFLADIRLRPKGLVLIARNPQRLWSKTDCYWGPRFKASVNTQRTEPSLGMAFPPARGSRGDC